MSRELADAIEADLSADENVVRQYENLMVAAEGDAECHPDEVPVSTTPRFPEVAFTESEKPDVSDEAELRPLLWSRLSQFIPEETNRS